jgi:hypothetical protein
MEKNDNYFNEKSEAEKLRNVSNLVDSIVNVKPDEALKETPAPEGEQEESPEPEVNPVVELVGKAISAGRPKGFFMQGVQTDDNPKI